MQQIEDQGLLAVGYRDGFTRYVLHPAVVTAARCLADPSLQAAVDERMAGHWMAALDVAASGDRPDADRWIRHAEHVAIPYFIRLNRWGGETGDWHIARLLGALSRRQRPLIVVIDDLEEATDPEQALRLLFELCRAARELPLRLLVATRQWPRWNEGVVEVLEVARAPSADIVEFACRHLLAGGVFGSVELARPTALVIAEHAQGVFLVVKLICGAVVTGTLPPEPWRLAGEFAKLDLKGESQPLWTSIRGSLEQWLNSLGGRRRDALVLLTALSRGPAAGMTASEWLEAASRLGERSFTETDLVWVERSGAVTRSRASGTYLLHNVIRHLLPEPSDSSSQPRVEH